jgi:hypothetical protein
MARFIRRIAGNNTEWRKLKMAGAPVPGPQPVVVTNAVDVHAVATLVHVVVDNPLPLPIIQNRPVEYMRIVMPVPAPADPWQWLVDNLNLHGAEGWRVAAIGLPGMEPFPGAILYRER